MKKIIFFILLTGSTLANAETINPFNNTEWATENNKLKIKTHELVEDSDHSISYNLPNGFSGMSDYCHLTSDTTLSCRSGDTVVYNADAHSMTLQPNKQSAYTYYEAGYQPAGNALSGTWNVINCKPESMYVATLVVPYAEATATAISNISEYSSTGFRNGNTYYVAVDKFSKIVYFGSNPNNNSNWGFYLYDANNKPITDVTQFNKVVKLRMPQSNNDNVYCEYAKN